MEQLKVTLMYASPLLVIAIALLFIVYRYGQNFSVRWQSDSSQLPEINFEDPEVVRRCQEFIVEEVAYRKAITDYIFAHYFSEHKGHEKTWLRDQYFDAMFESDTYSCSCGSELTITRAMVEAVPEAALPPKPGSNTIKPGASIPLL